MAVDRAVAGVRLGRGEGGRHGGREEEGKAWVDVEIGKEDEEKKHERMEADYVIGCDGSSSAVRRSLFGREWPGTRREVAQGAA